MSMEFEPVHGRPDDYDADYYDGNGQAGDRPALRWYVRMVRRYAGSGPYLEFGCGTGHLLRRLSLLDSVTGFEISPYSAGLSQVTAPGCAVHTSLSDIPDESFRALTAIHVLEHLDDDTAKEVLRCWRRVLMPGGRALVVMPDPAGSGRALAGPDWTGYQDPTHINLKSHGEWRSFISEAGFVMVREGSDGLWNVPYGGKPKFVEALRYAIPSLAQFLAGRLFLRPGSGESCIFIFEKAS